MAAPARDAVAHGWPKRTAHRSSPNRGTSTSATSSTGEPSMKMGAGSSPNWPSARPNGRSGTSSSSSAST